MKIKEAAAKSGLTEKTIRHYEDWGLIAPEKTELNGRWFREYSEADVESLRSAAALRRALFSIEQIKEMRQSPSGIPGTVAAHREELKRQYQRLTGLIAGFEALDGEALASAEGLSAALEAAAKPLPLPARDMSPHFGRFDTETEEERRQMYREYLKNLPARERAWRTKDALHKLLTVLLYLCTAAAVAWLVYTAGTRIPLVRQIKVTVDCLEWRDGDPDYLQARTVSIEGAYRRYLFADDRLDGSFAFLTFQRDGETYVVSSGASDREEAVALTQRLARRSPDYYGRYDWQ